MPSVSDFNDYITQESGCFWIGTELSSFNLSVLCIGRSLVFYTFLMFFKHASVVSKG